MVGNDEVGLDVATTKLVGKGGGGNGLSRVSGKAAINMNKPHAQTDDNKHKIVRALMMMRVGELLPRRGRGESKSSIMNGEYSPKAN